MSPRVRHRPTLVCRRCTALRAWQIPREWAEEPCHNSMHPSVLPKRSNLAHPRWAGQSSQTGRCCRAIYDRAWCRHSSSKAWTSSRTTHSKIQWAHRWVSKRTLRCFKNWRLSVQVETTLASRAIRSRVTAHRIHVWLVSPGEARGQVREKTANKKPTWVRMATFIAARTKSTISTNLLSRLLAWKIRDSHMNSTPWIEPEEILRSARLRMRHFAKSTRILSSSIRRPQDSKRKSSNLQEDHPLQISRFAKMIWAYWIISSRLVTGVWQTKSGLTQSKLWWLPHRGERSLQINEIQSIYIGI